MALVDQRAPRLLDLANRLLDCVVDLGTICERVETVGTVCGRAVAPLGLVAAARRPGSLLHDPTNLGLGATGSSFISDHNNLGLPNAAEGAGGGEMDEARDDAADEGVLVVAVGAVVSVATTPSEE